MPPVAPSHTHLLLAVAVGGLLAGAASTLGASDAPAAGARATAVVTASASCGSGARDTVEVAAPTGPLTTELDGCGQRVGTRVTVVLDADGSVGEVVALAGTRSSGGSSPVPVAVLVLAGLATAGVAAGERRSRRGPGPRG